MMQRLLLIVISFLVAIALTIVPVPSWAIWLRPMWVPMTLSVWVLLFPEGIGIGFAFCIGVFMDVLLGSQLGQHALLLCLLAYICAALNRSLVNLPMWQQTASMTLLMTLYLIGHLILQNLWGQNVTGWQYWLSLLTSALFWSPLFVTCRYLTQRQEQRVF